MIRYLKSAAFLLFHLSFHMSRGLIKEVRTTVSIEGEVTCLTPWLRQVLYNDMTCNLALNYLFHLFSHHSFPQPAFIPFMFNILIFPNIHCLCFSMCCSPRFSPLFFSWHTSRPNSNTMFFVPVVGSCYRQNYLPSLFAFDFQVPNMEYLLGTQK